MSPRIFFNTIRLRSKNIFFHGGVLGFYIIAAVTTFVFGIYGFVKMGGVDLNAVKSSSPSLPNISLADPSDDIYRLLQTIS
jgi:hypothetical protein